jgi:hypothetical protein
LKTIHKYPLDIKDFQEVDMPDGARILCVKTQPSPVGSKISEQIVMWAEVDTDNPLTPRRIRIFGTGNPVKYEHQIDYIGTVQMQNYALTWHIYENYIKELQ